MRAGRILLKTGAVVLIIVVAILSGITFVLSKAAGWILGPIILFVIGCIVFCMVSFRGLFSKDQFSANILSGDDVPAWFCERCQKVLAEIDVS